MQSRVRLLAGGIHLGGLVGVIGFGFAYWFLSAFARSAPLVYLFVLAVALTTYLIMRNAKRSSSFLKRQLTCAVGIQTLSLLVPLVMVVASILALFGVPGLGWFDSKLGLVTKGPFTGWGLNQVGALVGGGFVALLAAAAAVRAFREPRLA